MTIFQPATEIAARLRGRKLSSHGLTEAVLQHIDEAARRWRCVSPTLWADDQRPLRPDQQAFAVDRGTVRAGVLGTKG
jgi:hypothetical protein